MHHPDASAGQELSAAGAAYLEQIATDGTLAAAFADIAASDPQLAD